MIESWKYVIGYEGLYMISNLGRIKSLPKCNILSTTVDRYGYMRCKLSKYGKSNTVRIHRLVANAFVHRFEIETEVNHKDGVKSNNVYTNLEWVSHRYNVRHAYKSGLMSRKLTDDDVYMMRILYGTFDSIELSAIYGVSDSHVRNIINERRNISDRRM